MLLTIGLVLPLVLVGFYYLWIGRQNSRELLDESIKQQADLAATAFQQWIQTQTQTLATIVTLSESENQSTLRDYLNSIVKTRQHWLDVQIVDSTGRVTLSQTVREKPLPLVSIETLKREVDSQQALIISTEQLSDENLRLISLATPLTGGKSVVARIDGASASDIFKKLDLPEDYIIAVFDSNNRLIYRSNVSPEQMEMDVRNTPMLAAAVNERSAVIEIDSPYDGIRRVYGVARIETANCIVAVGLPSSRLYDAESRRFYRHIVFGLIITALAVIGAFFLSRSITLPMQVLTRAARAYGGGDFSARSTIKGSGAIRELGDTFDHMAQQISEREERSKEIDRLKSEFVGSVSHELRTPLTTIKTFVKVLQNDKLSQRERNEYLRTIASECDRQIEFVQNLLDLSRIEAGAFKPKFAEIDLPKLFMDIVTSGQRAAVARGLLLQLTIDGEEIPPVRMDAALLQRIVANLLDNAMKYTPKAGTVTVTLGQYAGRPRITVEDDGCGISADDIPHIFERFYRGRPIGLQDSDPGRDKKNSPENEAPGIGLGLYLVKSMIDELGAEIVVESPIDNSGFGTRFTIVLPLSRNT